MSLHFDLRTPHHSLSHYHLINALLQLGRKQQPKFISPVQLPRPQKLNIYLLTLQYRSANKRQPSLWQGHRDLSKMK